VLSSTSRYAQIDIATYSMNGATVPYLRRRFLPRPDSLPLMTTVTITPDSRIDLIAAKLQGDPQRYWKIADANAAMNPVDLMSHLGAALRIPRVGS
jgi:hypothetical protein